MCSKLSIQDGYYGYLKHRKKYFLPSYWLLGLDIWAYKNI